MLEIRFHGRGGQGTVLATILLSQAFFQAGYQVQSFPFFGVERRGALVEAYLRLDAKKSSCGPTSRPQIMWLYRTRPYCRVSTSPGV